VCWREGCTIRTEQEAREKCGRLSTIKILPPSLSPERVKVDDYCAARSGLIPPLPWPTLAPPFSQKAGKKKMRQFGKVEIPQETFISALKMDG
jgi:hypothetical protein